MERYLGTGFGVLVLVMATTQTTTLGFFNHIVLSYMTPLGSGGSLKMFVFPVTLLLIILEVLAAIAYLLMDKQNVMRETFMKCGIIVMVLWFLFVTSALLRQHPMPYAGFFGGHLKQPFNWFAGLQSFIFAVWGWLAFRVESEQKTP